MSKVKILIFTSALLASLSLALPAQACVVKSGKNCPSTVAHKVDHKVKLNKPGMVGGLGATTHTSPPEPLGAVPQQVVQTTPGAAHRPADFPIKPNLEYTFPTAHGQPHTYPSAVAQRNGAITNPDGSLTQHAIDLGFTVRAVNQSAPNMVPQPVATPNLQAPDITQAPVAQTVQAPTLQGEGKRAKDPVPDLYAQTPSGAHHRPADFPIKPYLEYTFPTAHGQPHTYTSAVAQRNGAITNPDGSLTQYAIDLGFTVRAVNQSAPNMVPQPVATPNLQAPPQNPAMTQVPVPQTVQAPNMVPQPVATPNLQAPVPVPQTVQAPNMVPQPVATPNLQVPPQNPAMTQVAVPQAVQPPNLAQPPHAVVYNALHAEIRPHEQVYDLHDPAFHLVVVGFKEP